MERVQIGLPPHAEALDHLAPLDMPFDDFQNIFARLYGIPNAFWVDDHRGPGRAGVQAACGIRARHPAQTASGQLLFEKVAERLRSLGGAAPPRIILGALIGADKQMMAQCGHVPGGHVPGGAPLEGNTEDAAAPPIQNKQIASKIVTSDAQARRRRACGLIVGEEPAQRPTWHPQRAAD